MVVKKHMSVYGLRILEAYTMKTSEVKGDPFFVKVLKVLRRKLKRVRERRNSINLVEDRTHIR